MQQFAMIEFTNSEKVSACSIAFRVKKCSVGFVPTMGALHQGHLALIRKAKKENDKVICSIFVNPLQFNNQKDFETYPNTLSRDLQLLKEENCDVVFLPEKEDLYGESPILKFDFGGIGKVMEGEKRPGHFDGMAAVVKRFLEVVQPTRAYFGEKDFQQLTIIKWLNNTFQLQAEIIGCKTIRETNGLALSSRNLLLTAEELEVAPLLYQTLRYCNSQYKKIPVTQLQEECIHRLNEKFRVEYFLIVDEETLQPIKNWRDSAKPRAFVVAHLGAVRLIDNLALID